MSRSQGYLVHYQQTVLSQLLQMLAWVLKWNAHNTEYSMTSMLVEY